MWSQQNVLALASRLPVREGRVVPLSAWPIVSNRRKWGLRSGWATRQLLHHMGPVTPSPVTVHESEPPSHIGAGGLAAQSHGKHRTLLLRLQVFLSATLANASEFAAWVASLHRQPCHIVYTDYRPTMLQHFAFPIGGGGMYSVSPPANDLPSTERRQHHTHFQNIHHCQ